MLFLHIFCGLILLIGIIYIFIVKEHHKKFFLKYSMYVHLRLFL